MITCIGEKKGKFLIKESEKGIRLVFTGKSIKQFEQVGIPKKPTKDVKFSMTIEDFEEDFPGFLPYIIPDMQKEGEG